MPWRMRSIPRDQVHRIDMGLEDPSDRQITHAHKHQHFRQRVRRAIVPNAGPDWQRRRQGACAAQPIDFFLGKSAVAVQPVSAALHPWNHFGKSGHCLVHRQSAANVSGRSRRCSRTRADAISVVRSAKRTRRRCKSGLSASRSAQAPPKQRCDKIRVTIGRASIRSAASARSRDPLQARLARCRRLYRRNASDAGSTCSSVNSSCCTIRRRIASAMPPSARPTMRPDTITSINGSWRTRASIIHSALTKARSSPAGIAGMPPTRMNASTVTARLAPDASV